MSQILGGGGGGGGGGGIVFVNPPPTNSSSGLPGMVAFDNSGHFFLCYATNSWSMFTGSTSFGIIVNLILLRNGVDHIALRDGVSRLDLGHN